jgi:hypothetical protein
LFVQRGTLGPTIELGGVPTMLDRDVKELLIGFTAIVIFAVAIVYLRQ